MQVTVQIYVETDSGEELEFAAVCEVGFGSPARGMMGPPEYSSPEEPGGVEWESVRAVATGETFDPDEFEERFGVKLSTYDEKAFDLAVDASEPDDPPDYDPPDYEPREYDFDPFD